MDYNIPTKNYAGKYTFSNLRKDYEESIDNLLYLTKINSQSRLEKYKKELDILSSLTDSESASELIVNNFKVRAAFIESHQIIQVSNFLSEYVKENTISENNIKKLQGGVYSYSESKSDDPSRDIFFEFYIASHLSNVGIKVDLSSITDIVAEFEGFKFFIECKRIKSKFQYKEKVKEGIRQLNNRFEKGKTKEVGITFISLTSVMNPNLDIMKVSNNIEIDNHSEKLCKDFVKENLGKYVPFEKKVLAVYNHLTIPYFNEQNRLVYYKTFDSFKSFFSVDTNGNPINPNFFKDGAPRSVLRNKYFYIFTKFDNTYSRKSLFCLT